tara:strand:- start:401 stop:910 length:510 start_codon:yes stop_codon:yes gene_type:complete
MGDDTLFSSYVSGGGYGGYSDFDPSDFGEGFSDEDLGEGWQDYLDLDWAGNDPLGFASEYAGSDFQETELDAFSQLKDLYQGFQSDIYGSRNKLAKNTEKFDLTSGRMGLISGRRMSKRGDILTDSTEEQQSLFSNYLSERTGLAGTIDQAREEYLDFLVEAGEDESNG